MGTLAGSMNCSLAEVMHMLDIIKKILPQGKDMWDSVSARYDATKASHWPNSDMESLRRKFKSLYGLHKPTGCADMPVHVGLAKEVKRLVDEASSVFVTSEDELEEERCPPPGQCQTLRPVPGPLGTPPAPTAALLTTADSPTVPENPGEVGESSRASQGSVCADTCDGYDSTGTLPSFSLSDDEEPTIDEVEAKEAPIVPSRSLRPVLLRKKQKKKIGQFNGCGCGPTSPVIQLEGLP
ncbi:hypothetical protein GQ600_26430 [Phytophthora cactorum]|nr:hypothetical protein GQ600_26430 [Phytophthora cactorum]